MDNTCRSLKERHTFSDFVYWNLVLVIPVLTACIGLAGISIAGLVAYLVILAALTGVVMRFFCTHCPHYIQGENNKVKCMFFWGMPKFFKPTPGPLSTKDKAVIGIAAICLMLLPIAWLIRTPGLLVIYLLSFSVFILTIRRYECHQCIYLDCPVNRAPADETQA